MTRRQDRLFAALRHGDASRVDEVFPAARRAAILAAIAAGEPAVAPAPRRRSWRPGRIRGLRPRVALPAFAVLLACVLAIALVLATGSSPNRRSGIPVVHASPVSFRYPRRGADSGYIIATVTDPLAAQSSLDAAFHAAGLDIAVNLVPASPSAVGTVVEIDESANAPQIETLAGGTCVTGGGGPGNCPIGLKIPRDFTGSGAITLGRPAKPGEDYDSTNSSFAPGEGLHCSGLIGQSVADASKRLGAEGITVEWQVLGTAGGKPAANTPVAAPGTASAGAPGTTTPVATATSTVATTTTATNTSATSTASTTTSESNSSSSEVQGVAMPPGDYHVVDGTPIRAGVVMVLTQRAPLSATVLAQETRMYGGGCS